MNHVKVLQELGALEASIWTNNKLDCQTKSELALRVSSIWCKVHEITPPEEFEGNEYKEAVRKALNGQGIVL